jgi:hypothetical protein
MKNDFDKMFKKVGTQEDDGKKKPDTKDTKPATPAAKPDVNTIGW